MNHYSARLRQSDDKWDYTCSNKRTGIHPIGYCRGWKEFTADHGFLTKEECERFNREEEPFINNYHSDGHATEMEACECYRRYILDHRTRFYPSLPNPDSLHRCSICQEFTSGIAEVDNNHRWYLCDIHRTMEYVKQLFPPIGESWSSY